VPAGCSGDSDICQNRQVRFRLISDLTVNPCDAVWEDDEHVLVIDRHADVWRIGLDGMRTRLSTGRQLRAALTDPDTSQAARPSTPTPGRITWHGQSRSMVVHVDHDVDRWSLVGRVDAGPWQRLLTGSLVLSTPALAWSPDGRHIAVNIDGVAVIDLAQVQPCRVQSAEAWGWTPGGQLVIYDSDAILRLVDPSTGQQSRLLGQLQADFDAWGWPEAIAVDSNGNACVIAYRRRLVWYCLTSLKALHIAGNDDDLVNDITVTADRSTVVVEYDDGVRLWNLATAEPLTPLLPIAYAQPSPSGHYYVCRSSMTQADGGTARWSTWELA
jgi:hypothetical protein